MQTTNPQRIRSWDFIKFVAIFLVIWGHCIKGFLPTDYLDSTIFRSIYSFHMPLFMMIAGFFSVSSIGMGKKEFVQKKFMRLIYPCIIWGGGLWIVLELANSFHYGHSEYSLIGLLTDFYWLSDFWFLKSCFICYILVYIGVHSKVDQLYWMLVTLLISQTISPFFVSFMYPCFLIGYLLKQYPSFMKFIKSYSYPFILLFLFMLCFWDKDMWINSHGIPQGIGDFDILQLLRLIFYRLFRLLLGIIGSLAFISFFLSFDSVISESRIVLLCCKLGKYTLNIYILQRIILEMGISRLVNLHHLNSFALSFIITPFVSLIVLLLCVYTTEMIKKTPKLERILWGV